MANFEDKYPYLVYTDKKDTSYSGESGGSGGGSGSNVVILTPVVDETNADWNIPVKWSEVKNGMDNGTIYIVKGTRVADWSYTADTTTLIVAYSYSSSGSDKYINFTLGNSAIGFTSDANNENDTLHYYIGD